MNKKLKKIIITFLSILILTSLILIILYLSGAMKNGKKEVIKVDPVYLMDVVKVGDIVNYDVGKWNETVAIPNKDNTFGGYEKGQSKSMSVSCGYNKVTSEGFKVFTKTEDEITLISVGNPLCYYHGYGKGNSGKSVETINAFINEENIYLNKKFADKVEVFSKDTIDDYLEEDSSYKRIEDEFIKVGNPYWLASSYNDYSLWYVTEGGTIATNRVGAYGIRIVISLKKDVLTTGQNSEGIWQLIKK